MGELLLYIRCEAAKLRRKPLFAVLAASSVLLPLAFAFFLSDPPDSRTAVIQTMASLIQLSAYVVLIPAVAVLAANLLFEEQDNDTLKNLLCVPVSKARLAVAKLLMLLGFAVVFMAVGALVVLAGCGQILGASATTALVCLPLVLVFGQRRGGYLPGAILTFFLGYSILFFKSGVLLSAYPFSAALILVGFDMRGYNGATAAPQPLLSALGLAAMPALALVLLALSGRWGRRTLPARAARHRRGRRR